MSEVAPTDAAEAGLRIAAAFESAGLVQVSDVTAAVRQALGEP